MPIPVSVTGFATSAGAHSAVAGSTNIDLVAAGTAPRAAATNDGSLASMMNMDTTPVATAAAAAAPTPAAKPASDRAAVSGEVLVEVNGLDFCYPATDGRPLVGVPPMITDMKLELMAGECALLLGANGAGKTTLLKILGGYHMIPKHMVQVLGAPPFHETKLTMSGDLSYIGGTWSREVAFAGNSIPLSGDFSARKMIEGIQGADQSRREELMEVLDINPNWRMHRVSDGQRRRVQLCVGLLRPYKVLLLDEITVDLDVLGRADLLDYLKKDARKRNAVVLYATHIFDGLEEWLDSVAFISRGKLQFKKKQAEMPEIKEHGLLATVSGWLRTEKEIRQQWLAENPQTDATQRPKGQYANNNGYSSGTLASTLAGSSNCVWRN